MSSKTLSSQFLKVGGQVLKAHDVHTHMYLPGYMNILRKRTQIPRVQTINNEDRLIILPGEDDEQTTAVGRPIGREYWDVTTKLKYMDAHHIEKSVISLANPWLDFLEGNEAEAVAQELNDELQCMCEQSTGRLYGFATLPVRNAAASVKEVERIAKLDHIRGVILGTPGAGKGLDHEGMRDVLGAIESNDLMIFMHPHYGVGNEHFYDSGHSMFLALGFPFETTVAVTRLIVSGTLDKFPNLKLLVAHAGAAMPSLIGRLDSCVAHDIAVSNRLQHAPSHYFRNMYFDAIAYSKPAIDCIIEFAGEDNIMFGTDNPFFPPPEGPITDLWPSTMKVYDVLSHLPENTQKKICTLNSSRLLRL